MEVEASSPPPKPSDCIVERGPEAAVESADEGKGEGGELNRGSDIEEQDLRGQSQIEEDGTRAFGRGSLEDVGAILESEGRSPAVKALEDALPRRGTTGYHVVQNAVTETGKDEDGREESPGREAVPRLPSESQDEG